MILDHQQFKLNGKIIVERFRFQTPFQVGRRMEEEACLLFNLKGNTQLYHAQGKTQLQAADCVLMPCGQYFTRHPEQASKEPSEVLAIHFYPEILQQIFESNQHPLWQQAPTEQLTAKFSINTVLLNYLNSLLFYFEHPQLVTDELIYLKVKEIILLLLHLSSQEGNLVRTILSNLFQPQHHDFRAVIEQHLFEDLTLTQLALLTHHSLSSFKRKFKALYQQAPAQYIRSRKIARAQQLLQQSQLSVYDICFECGFRNPSNFAKIFAKYTGLTPLAFRKQQQL